MGLYQKITQKTSLRPLHVIRRTMGGNKTVIGTIGKRRGTKAGKSRSTGTGATDIITRTVSGTIRMLRKVGQIVDHGHAHVPVQMKWGEPHPLIEEPLRQTDRQMILSQSVNEEVKLEVWPPILLTYGKWKVTGLTDTVSSLMFLLILKKKLGQADGVAMTNTC